MAFQQLFPFKTKYNILLFFQQFKKSSAFNDVVLIPGKRRAFIFLAADYGNLGDVAITYAQTQFLNDNSDFQVIEIPISQSLEGLWFVKKHIQATDIVTTVGGGNLGDLYDQIEYIRQLVVRFFPNNKIISFPQTFDFSESPEGLRALEVAKKAYNKHRNLHFIAREVTSFGLMQQHFKKAKVYLTPDIVISLDKTKPVQNREGVVVCMRKDMEKSISEAQSKFIINALENRFGTIRYYDTHINKNYLTPSERVAELEKIWAAFRSAELVVTDRLHGMIFCYITNTPCLVFQNNNHKVRETFDWIKANSNINLVTVFSEDLIADFLKRERFDTGGLLPLKEKYQPLVDLLN